jgi:hypothetical protein
MGVCIVQDMIVTCERCQLQVVLSSKEHSMRAYPIGKDTWGDSIRRLSLDPYHPPSSTTLSQMTDPITLIGLVASVLQLVDTATTVYDYASDVKNAPREQRELSSEYASLKPLLEEFQKRERQVDQSNPNDPRVTGMRCLEESLADCEKKMKKLAVTLESSGLKKILKRLTWTHHKAEIKDTILTIGRFKAILNDWLQIDLW